MKICIYGASGDRPDKVYFDEAYKLGSCIASGNHILIFGGGNGGLMGACARGAADNGGEIIAVAPRFFDEPGILFQGCTKMIFSETMAERKALMEEMCDAFIVLPGGIGTFEEFFETLTLKQLGRLNKPIAILNTAGYYAYLLAALDNAVMGGFLSEACLGLFKVCGTAPDAVEHCKIPEEARGSIRRLEDYCK